VSPTCRFTSSSTLVLKNTRCRLQEPQSAELADVLNKVILGELVLGTLRSQVSEKTFHARLIDLMDQAQHFGGGASSLGVSSTGDPGEEFREGLESTEREREFKFLGLPSR
jgi:hypothetical protein